MVDPGLRSIPFESVVLAVRVTETTATVARVFHHSRDWMKQLQRDSET
jgi:plasmid stabilization system protein ParE